MHSKSFFMTVTMFLPLTFAGVIQRRDASENVIMVNCEDQNGGEVSSRMAYYSGEVNATPNTQVILTTGRTQVWEGAPVSGTFPDSDEFTANIPTPVGDGAYAGTARNQDSPFYCYGFKRAFVYSDGNVYCTGAYRCDHTAPTHVASKITVDVSTSNQYVELTDLGVWNSRGSNTCQSDPIPMGDKCTIEFNCFGAIPWTTTNGMAATLVNVIGAQNGIGTQWNEQVSSCAQYCSTPTGSYCCNEQSQTVWHTKIIPSLTIVSLLTPDMHGSIQSLTAVFTSL